MIIQEIHDDLEKRKGIVDCLTNTGSSRWSGLVTGLDRVTVRQLAHRTKEQNLSVLGLRWLKLVSNVISVVSGMTQGCSCTSQFYYTFQ
jgi:hypothetical protein